MLGRGILKSAESLLAAAVGLVLPQRKPPGGLAPTKGTGQELLRRLFAGDAPGDLLSAVVGDDSAALFVRCRFARDADLGACAAWVQAKVSTWLGQRTPAANRVEISEALFEPVVEARGRT
jgi:hypothetical protein